MVSENSSKSDVQNGFFKYIISFYLLTVTLSGIKKVLNNLYLHYNVLSLYQY